MDATQHTHKVQSLAAELSTAIEEAGKADVFFDVTVTEVPDGDVHTTYFSVDVIDTSLATFPPSKRLSFFDYAHLPLHLQLVSRLFFGLARRLDRVLVPGGQKEIALQHLLDAKDAAVRAALKPGV